MGVALLVLGVFAFVAAVVVSRRTPAPAQAASGEPPQPGDGEVPWLPAVKIGSLVLAIIGLLMIIFG